jgi:hypothetical protein
MGRPNGRGVERRIEMSENTGENGTPGCDSPPMNGLIG